MTFRATGRGAIIAGTSRFEDRDVAISILASHIVLEGFDVRVDARDDARRSRGIRASGVHDRHVSHVQLRGNTFSKSGWGGITVSYADDVVIEGNEVWGTRGQHSIHLANSGDRPVVRNNVVHNNREAGIQLNGDPRLPGDGIISGAQISGNRLYRNGCGGSAALNLASDFNVLGRVENADEDLVSLPEWQRKSNQDRHSRPARHYLSTRSSSRTIACEKDRRPWMPFPKQSIQASNRTSTATRGLSRGAQILALSSDCPRASSCRPLLRRRAE